MTWNHGLACGSGRSLAFDSAPARLATSAPHVVAPLFHGIKLTVVCGLSVGRCPVGCWAGCVGRRPCIVYVVTRASASILHVVDAVSKRVEQRATTHSLTHSLSATETQLWRFTRAQGCTKRGYAGISTHKIANIGQRQLMQTMLLIYHVSVRGCKRATVQYVSMLYLHNDVFLILRLHDKTGYQTGCTTGWTTGCIV